VSAALSGQDIQRIVETTESQAKAMRKARKLAPTKDDIKREFPKGYYEKLDEHGKRVWGAKVRTFDENGHKTREGAALEAMMNPFMKAEAERGRARPKPFETTRMRDRDGGLREVPVHLAETAALKNGWSGVMRPQGNRVERGAGGMLWRLIHGEWMPLGVTCLGTPLFGGDPNVPVRGLQYDPDGAPWRGIRGEWRRV